MITQATDLGAAAVAVTARDEECAQLQLTPLRIAGVCLLGGIGAALTGVYKLGKGKGSQGLVAFATTAGFWFLGNRLVVSAANTFQACRGQPPIAPVPLSPKLTTELGPYYQNVRTGSISPMRYGQDGYLQWVAAQGNDEVRPSPNPGVSAGG